MKSIFDSPNKNKQERIFNVFTIIRYQKDRKQWLEDSKIGYDFFLGEQLTKEEKERLKEKGMPDFISESIAPQIELMCYFVTANYPRWKAIGVQGDDTDLAAIHSDIAQYVFQNSKGDQKLYLAVQDSFTKGVGYLEVSFDPDLDDGFGEVVLTHEDPWEIYVDPKSKDPLFDDASYIIKCNTVTQARARILFPDVTEEEWKLVEDADDVQTTESGSVQIHQNISSESALDILDKEVMILTAYEKMVVSYVRMVVKQPMVEGEEQKLEEFVLTKSDYLKSIKENIINKDNIVSEIHFKKTEVFKTVTIGSKLIIEDMVKVPCEHYPIIAIQCYNTGSPFNKSISRRLTDKQKEMNKAHQLMIHNANIGSNVRFMAEENSMDSKVENDGAKPGAVITYRRQSDGNPPQVIQPMPLNSAFYDLTKISQQQIEYQSGMMAHSMGGEDYSGREPYRGLLARDEFGTRRIRGWVKNILNFSLQRLGLVIDSYSRNYYTLPKVMNIVNPEDTDENQEFIINQPYSEGDIQKFFDIKELKTSLMFVAGSTLEVNRWAYLSELERYLSIGIIDSQEFIMHTDLRKKKQILARVSEIQQYKAQVADMQSSIEELIKQNQMLEDQLVMAKVNNRVETIVNGLLRDADKTKAVLEKLVKETEVTMKEILSEAKVENKDSQ